MNGFRKLLAASLSALLLLALWPASALAANEIAQIVVGNASAGTLTTTTAPTGDAGATDGTPGVYKLVLTDAVEDDAPAAAATVDVDHNGTDASGKATITLDVSGTNAENFDIKWAAAGSPTDAANEITMNSDEKLEIAAKGDLPAGTYTAAIELTATGGSTAEIKSTINIEYTVDPALTLDTATAESAGTAVDLDFAAQDPDAPMTYDLEFTTLVGYTAGQVAVEIDNAAAAAIDNVSTTPTAGDPKLTTAWMTGTAGTAANTIKLKAGAQSDTLQLKYAADATVGDHKATITIAPAATDVSNVVIDVTWHVVEAIALRAPSSGKIEFADTLIEGGYDETAATGVAETANKGLVTVENNSGASVYVKHSISGTGAAAFVLYKDSTGIDAKMTTDEKGDSYTITDGNGYSFWVVPAIDLDAGTYTANLTITQVAAGGASMAPEAKSFTKTIPLTIEIKDATTTLEVTNVTLSTIVKDAALPSPATITITNNGNSPATITGITLAGGENSPFQLGSAPSSAQTIAVSGTYTTATIAPKATTLAVGTYTDTIRVMNGEKVVAEGTVSFEIEAPDYTLDVTDVVITSQDAGGSQPGTATITITGVGNSATAISAITLKDGTNFTIDGTTSGAVSQAGTFTSATVQPKATIDYTKAGVYTDTIIVSYATGLTATGTVRFAIVEAGDATLASLAVTEGSLSPAFSAGTTAYTVHVASTVESIKVIPSANDTRATIKVGGATVTSGDASSAIVLVEGTNTPITVTVTPNGGGDAKEYKITVIRSGSGSSGSGGSSSGSNGSNGSWPGDNYPPAPPPPAEVLPGTPGSSSPTTPSVTNPFSFRVLARSLNVRSGPGTSFAKVGTLRANDVVSIVGYSADGLWAQTQAGSWVSLAYVSQVVTVDVGDYIVTVKSGTLNVRSGPGTSSAKIGSLANNALVMVNSVTNGWAQIEYNGGVGYVSVLYLR